MYFRRVAINKAQKSQGLVWELGMVIFPPKVPFECDTVCPERGREKGDRHQITQVGSDEVAKWSTGRRRSLSPVAQSSDSSLWFNLDKLIIGKTLYCANKMLQINQ